MIKQLKSYDTAAAVAVLWSKLNCFARDWLEIKWSTTI